MAFRLISKVIKRLPKRLWICLDGYAIREWARAAVP